MIPRSLYIRALPLTMRSRPIHVSEPRLLPKRLLSSSTSQVLVASIKSSPMGTVSLPKMYDPRTTLDTISRVLSSGSASRKSLRHIGMELVTPAHQLVAGRRRIASLLMQLPTTTSGGKLKIQQTSPEDDIELTRSVTEDLYWWLGSLSKGLVPLAAAPVSTLPRCSHLTYCDASASGGTGVVVDKTWYHWAWTKAPCVDVQLAEAIAVEMALATLTGEYGVRNAHITIRCDNKHVINAWMGRRSPTIDPVLERVLRTLHDSNCWLELMKVPSRENLADKPSRNKEPNGSYTRRTWFGN